MARVFGDRLDAGEQMEISPVVQRAILAMGTPSCPATTELVSFVSRIFEADHVSDISLQIAVEEERCVSSKLKRRGVVLKTVPKVVEARARLGVRVNRSIASKVQHRRGISYDVTDSRTVGGCFFPQDGVSLDDLRPSTMGQECDALDIWVGCSVAEMIQQRVEDGKSTDVAIVRVHTAIASCPSVRLVPGQSRRVEDMSIAMSRKEQRRNPHSFLGAVHEASRLSLVPCSIEDLVVDVGVALDTVKDDEGVRSLVFVIVVVIAAPSKDLGT